MYILSTKSRQGAVPPEEPKLCAAAACAGATEACLRRSSSVAVISSLL